jgi:hypothetical protein
MPQPYPTTCESRIHSQGNAFNRGIYASSAELVRDRYAVQAIPMVDTKGWEKVSIVNTKRRLDTHNLELNGHHTEVDDLHCRPNQEIGFQGGDVDILELALQCTLSTAFSNGHESEESGKTWES